MVRERSEIATARFWSTQRADSLRHALRGGFDHVTVILLVTGQRSLLTAFPTMPSRVPRRDPAKFLR